MITADTITDEQIGQLLRLGEDGEADAALRALRNPRRFFNGLGVGDSHMADQAERQRKARAQCARLLNARIAERRCRECMSACDHSTWDGLNCPWCRNTGRRVIACTTCDDTHRMTLGDREVMCTRCPVPCHVCRVNGNGAFCSTTPCVCGCHRPKSTAAAVTP